ncbi:hypothetical protein B0T11DRAFT_141977 [Plectosphaerella cucumerina]|uniref:Secreted protein n=1 Tax=Plectosphaerella cucumerina TaxID=40658 RepID=A0A8K0T8K4_9PEZI|nr:hypothetical protein B0T11DRAFT_141977 [Plectosphaerella cucumerina]
MKTMCIDVRSCLFLAAALMLIEGPRQASAEQDKRARASQFPSPVNLLHQSIPFTSRSPSPVDPLRQSIPFAGQSF